MSKSRKEMSPAVLQPYTTAEHTLLWMQSSRKVMEKCVPETTYWREHAGEFSGENAGKGRSTHFVDEGHEDGRDAVA